MTTIKLTINEVNDLAKITNLQADGVTYDSDSQDLNINNKVIESAVAIVLKNPNWREEAFTVLKTELKIRIDNKAESTRLNYITGGVGQSLTYQEKVAQAVVYSKAFAAFKTNPKENVEPNADEYLLLQASLGIDGDTLAEVAETVTYAYARWQQIGAGIEKVRLEAKADIDEATTAEAAQAVYDGIKWPNT